MEAVVTLKLAPREFDMLRESVTFHMEAAKALVTDAAIAADARHRARQNEAQLAELLRKLNS
jgi:hypothetical protein